MNGWKHALAMSLCIGLAGCSDEGDLNSELGDDPQGSGSGGADGSSGEFELFNDTGLAAFEQLILQASQPAGLDLANRASIGATHWVRDQLGEQGLIDSGNTPARLGCAEGGRLDVQATLDPTRGDTFRMNFEACGLDGRVLDGSVVSTDSSRSGTTVLQHEYTDFSVTEGGMDVALSGSSSRDYQLETQDEPYGGATEKADVAEMVVSAGDTRTRYVNLILFNKLSFNLQTTENFIGYRRDFELSTDLDAPAPASQAVSIHTTIPFRQYGAESTRGRLQASLRNGDTLAVETNGGCLAEVQVTRSSTDGATLSDTLAWDSPRNLLGALPQPRFRDRPIYTEDQSPCEPVE